MKIVNGQRCNEVMITNDAKNGLINVSISVDPQGERDKPVRITTKDVIPYLQNDLKMELGECVKSSVITNTTENSYFGTWVFKMKNVVEVIEQVRPIEIVEEVKAIKKKKEKDD